MKKLWLTCMIAATVGLGGCRQEKDLFKGEEKKEESKEPNLSDFSTEQKVQLDINYTEANAKVLFYLYDENPLIFSENSVSMKEGIAPLDAAWTDENGKFTGEVTLPAYVSDVYIVTGAFYAKTLIEGKIVNGVLSVSDKETEAKSARVSYKWSKYEKGRFDKLGWNNNLGSYDANGTIKYSYQGKESELILSSSESKSIKQTVQNILGRWKDCPEEYRTAADLYVEKENTAIVLTALKGNTCWNSSLGYYYYKEGHAPTSLKDIAVYTIFPNTQSGWWADNRTLHAEVIGLKEETAVRLKFFDEAHPDGTNFPAGYRIGFVLACNAWDYYFTGYSSYPQTTNYFSSSTTGLSSKGAGNTDVHTAMFKDQKSGNIVIAFEDFKDDQNFTDVIFTLKSNPEIKNIPVVDPDENTTIEKTGIYAFEDQWPKAGDYDMNDVLTEYIYQKKFDSNNIIKEESFIFKTFTNIANYNNGLGFSFTGDIPTNNYDTYIKKQGETEFSVSKDILSEENGKVFLLTDNVKNNMGAEYKVTYHDLKQSHEGKIEVFIYRPSSNDPEKRWEVHCPMTKPTNKMDLSYFGTEDDISVPASGKYYVSDKENMYPFAFYLSNANNKDIAPLLERSNESKPISELYSRFLDWAKYGTNSNWYKN